MASKSSPSVLLFVLLCVFAAVVITGQWAGKPRMPLPGPLPTANVGGWLNTPGPLESSDLKGKWVVVDGWATWCGPCMMSLPELAEFRERWPGDQVVLIGLAEDDDPSLVQAVIDQTPGFTWPVAYGGGRAQQSMGIDSLPTLVLYDPAGKEVTRLVGFRGESPTNIELIEQVMKGGKLPEDGE